MDYLNELFQNVPLIVNILFFIIGLVMLIKGSDFFVDSAVFFARKFHVSELVIGLTLVSIGTSLPELATNISSIVRGRATIAMGNITGSNITNIALILGVSALMMGSISFDKKVFYRDGLVMLGATVMLVLFAFFFDGQVYRINKIESFIMLASIIVYLVCLVKFDNSALETDDGGDSKIKSVGIAVLLFIVGFVGIYFGSEVMVGNVIIIAEAIHIPEGIISATVVALGTSLPELAVTIIGIVKKKSDLSLGNIIGSNIFNILGILGITGLIGDLSLMAGDKPDMMMMYFILPMMLLVALLLMVCMRVRWRLTRISGILLLLVYIGYVVLNYTGVPWLTK